MDFCSRTALEALIRLRLLRGGKLLYDISVPIRSKDMVIIFSEMPFPPLFSRNNSNVKLTNYTPSLSLVARELAQRKLLSF